AWSWPFMLGSPTHRQPPANTVTTSPDAAVASQLPASAEPCVVNDPCASDPPTSRQLSPFDATVALSPTQKLLPLSSIVPNASCVVVTVLPSHTLSQLGLCVPAPHAEGSGATRLP